MDAAIHNSHPLVSLAVKGLEVASAPVSFAISLTPAQSVLDRGFNAAINGVAGLLGPLGIDKEDVPFLLGGTAAVIGLAASAGRLRSAVSKAGDVIRDAPNILRRFIRDERGSIDFDPRRVFPISPEPFANGIFEASPKHTTRSRNTSRGIASRGPINGQVALDNSVLIKETSTRRLGVDIENQELVIFDQTRDGIFHGHVRTFEQLDQVQRNILIEQGIITKKGKFR